MDLIDRRRVEVRIRESLSPIESQEVRAERYFPGDIPEREASLRERMSSSKAGEWTRSVGG